MEGREDIEGEQFCAMEEQSCSEIVPPAKVLSNRNSFVQQEKWNIILLQHEFKMGIR